MPSLESPDNLDDHIQLLVSRTTSHPELETLICKSLQEARRIADKTLDKCLFDALTWPTTFPQYIDFLTEFARWAPRESTNPAWATPDGDGQQEVYDRGCQFYWLIDQKAGPEGLKIVQSLPWFRRWMVGFAKLYGAFLDTPASFGPDLLQSFIDLSPKYCVGDSMIDGKSNCPSGWQTFNQFFARELNSGLRPVASATDNTVLVSPADCTFKQAYEIDRASRIPGITIKGTHKFSNIRQLLDNSPYSDAFSGGTFLHFFLGPFSYHRFHAPVSGVLKECRTVRGLNYMGVDLHGDQFLATDDAQNGYEFVQARGLTILDTTNSVCGDVGIVGIVPVGMCHISSVNFTTQRGATMAKGEELGFFAFGGSDIIVLLQENACPQQQPPQDYLSYGMAIADI